MKRRSENPSGWLARRRERKRLTRERTGDTPEKTAEAVRGPHDGDPLSVADSAQRASAGLMASSPPFQG